MKSIDLGMGMDRHAVPMKMDEDHYPSLTYDGPEELNLPEYGTMTIKYRKTRSSESKMGDHTMHSCTIEALEILDVEAEKDERPAKSHDEAGPALDKLLAEKRARKQSKSERY